MPIRVSVITSVYKGEDYFVQFFENVVSQTYFDSMEIVLIHNEPTLKELAVVNQFKDEHPTHIQHIIVNVVEKIGVSWNKASQIASGDLLAIWNINDRRTNNSIECQVRALDDSLNAVMSYGDFYRVPSYGSTEGNLIETPEFSLPYFRRSFPQGGVFYMWRKEIMPTIGGFDEQLITQDYDFSLRIVMNGFHMVRADALLGYFTDSGDGLSTQDGGKKAAIENNMLFLRYAIYDKIQFAYLFQSLQYDIDHLCISGEFVHMCEFWPNYKKYRLQRLFLILLFPVRELLRLVFNIIGVLPLLHKFQNKNIKRDI